MQFIENIFEKVQLFENKVAIVRIDLEAGGWNFIVYNLEAGGLKCKK